MGVDLTLLLEPWGGDSAMRGTIYPSVRLPLERRHALWDRIQDELETLPLGQDIYDTDDDHGLVKVSQDAYGEPLRYAQAGSLAKLIGDFNSHDEFLPWLNAAAVAYLEKMEPFKRIILWWH